MKRVIMLILLCFIITGCTIRSELDTTTHPQSAAPNTIETHIITSVPSASVIGSTAVSVTTAIPAVPPTPSSTAETPNQPSTQPTAPGFSKPPETTPTVSVPSTTQNTDPLEQLLLELSLEERVGQLFLARCPDINAIADISKYHLGGYVLFARDFENETPESVRETIADYQSAAKIPLLIAVDEEGGTVNRVSKYPAFRAFPFASPRNLYAQGGISLLKEDDIEKCMLLRSIGINTNLAPVCDITTDPNAFMYRRSLGQSPQITGEYISEIISVRKAQQVGSVLKHFPGYGNNTDTHVAIAVDDRPLSQLEQVDLVPFAAGIQAGCDAIMVSHVYINAIDAEIPATLSPAVHQYLRESMGFTGVIATDDLVMRAITDVYGVGESAILAVEAGNDLLCVTDYKIQYDAVLDAVKTGRISEERLNESVIRILSWKSDLGLLQ